MLVYSYRVIVSKRTQTTLDISDNDLEEYEEALIDDGFDDMEALLAILESDIDAIGFTLADKRMLMNAIDKFRATADLEYIVYMVHHQQQLDVWCRTSLTLVRTRPCICTPTSI